MTPGLAANIQDINDTRKIPVINDELLRLQVDIIALQETRDKGCERLLTLRLPTSDDPVTLLSAYAPTLSSTPEAKDEFYTNLNDVIKNVHNKHLVLLAW
ncbi:hypothetical protein ACOMHN_020911 [Nucella lapillus]